jgi:hypothetical protein
LQGLQLKEMQGAAAKILIVPVQADGALAQHVFARAISAEDSLPTQATPISGPNGVLLREDVDRCSFESAHTMHQASRAALRGAVGAFVRFEQAGVHCLYDNIQQEHHQV